MKGVVLIQSTFTFILNLDTVVYALISGAWDVAIVHGGKASASFIPSRPALRWIDLSLKNITRDINEDMFRGNNRQLKCLSGSMMNLKSLGYIILYSEITEQCYIVSNPLTSKYRIPFQVIIRIRREEEPSTESPRYITIQISGDTSLSNIPGFIPPSKTIEI